MSKIVEPIYRKQVGHFIPAVASAKVAFWPNFCNIAILEVVIVVKASLMTFLSVFHLSVPRRKEDIGLDTCSSRL